MLEGIFERLLETSPKFAQLNRDFVTIVESVGKVVAAAKNIDELADTVVCLVRLVQEQQSSIIELYELQEQIMQHIKKENDVPRFPHREIKDEDIN